MSGFVVCRECGTRIKAGRGHCLRCFAPLPDPDEPLPTPLTESLGLSRNTEITVAAGTALVVVVLGYFIWQTWPSPVTDDVPPTASPGPIAASSAPATPALEAAPAAAAPEASTDPNLEATRVDYEQQLANRPKDARLLTRLGQLLERMGRPEEAAARYERAVALDPLDPASRLNMARAAATAGQWDRAINQYREAVRLRPKDLDTVILLGQALQKKGDDQAAVTEFQRVRGLNPSSAPVALGLATSLEKTGRIDDAIAEFRHYLELVPAGPDAERVKGHLALLARGRPQVK